MASANENYRDAAIRHQIGLMRFSGHVRNRILSLLDATEASLREQLARLSSVGTTAPAGGAGAARLRAIEQAIISIRQAAVDRSLDAWREELQALSVAESGFLAASLSSTVPAVLDVVLPPPARLRSLVQTDPFQGRILKDWAKDLARADRDRLLTGIRVGVALGETPKELTSRVLGAARTGAGGLTDITRRQAAAITRTAVNHFANRARDTMMQENSDLFSEELYVATLDSRTTPVCRARDGEKYPVGKGPKPPLHFNCRSLRVAVIDGQVIGSRPLKPTTERAILREYAGREGFKAPTGRDGLPRGHKGKFDEYARKRVRELTGTAPAATTYNTFLRNQGREFQDEVLGKTKAQLFRSGGLTLDRFVNRRGDELTLRQLARKEAGAFKRAGLNPEDFLKG